VENPLAKIGDALKKAVEEESTTPDESGKKERISSVLMNVNRRNIYRFLCQRPCSSVGDLTARLSISRATTSWHLKILKEAGYVESLSFNNKEFFAPKDMVSHGDTMIITAILNDSRCNMLFKAVIENNGASTTTLRESLQITRSITPSLKKLEAVGLITSVKDGKQIRFFPTTKLEDTVKAEGARLKAFRRTIIKRMESEHLKPVIEEIKGSGLVIILNYFDQAEEILIPYKPLEAILAAG
jgi:predicted transcriptional regulator